MASKLEMSYKRSRLVILNRLLSYPTVSAKDWNSDLSITPKEGDLVSLSAAPPSRWQLSWLVEIQNPSHGCYLLKSTEDGSLCNWSNVGLNVYDRERVNNNPHWKWNDRQFAFNDKWLRTCKRKGSYLTRPKYVDFKDDYKAELSLYHRLDFDNKNKIPVCHIEDWRKFTSKQMAEYFLENCKD